MTDWTLSTFIAHTKALRESDREALKLQAAEYERRLDNLNHEHARIAATQITYVSREIWDRAEKEDRDWKNKMDVYAGTLLSRSEFDAYRQATDRALRLKEGESHGIGLSALAVFNTVMAIAALAGVVIMLLRR